MPDYPRRPPLSDHLPLSVPVFQILLSLSDQDLHGYAIIQDVRQRTAGEVALTASTLYAALKRLLEAGLVEELDQRPPAEDDDDRRRYYRIRPDGRRVATLETERLMRAVRMAKQKRLAPRRA